jgi:hypothetical protein
MDKNMQCRGMQFEVGKSYHVDGEIIPCENGLHFCERLIDVFDFYKYNGNRFFEVEASGTVKKLESKSVASDIYVVRELSDIEINRTVYGNGYGCGFGYGFGYGYGYSKFNGDGYGDGWGNGYGCGDGYGCSNGDGCGAGYSDNVQEILIYA